MDETGTVQQRLPSARRRRLGGPYPRPPRWFHRLGHLPGQPGSASTPTSVRSRMPPAGAAVREGTALLQGLAVCGTCGAQARRVLPRPPQVHARLLLHRHRRTRRRGAACGTYRVGGVGIDAAVTAAFLAALAPAGLQACLAAARTAGGRRGRRARAVAPRGGTGPLPGSQSRTSLPGRRPGQPARCPRPWKPTGKRRCVPSPMPKPNWLAAKTSVPKPLPHKRKPAILALGGGHRIGMGRAHHHRPGPQRTAPHPARRSDHPCRQGGQACRPHAALARRRAHRTMRTHSLRQAPAKIRTSEDTIALIRRLAAHRPDTVIAGILNRQGRTSARGQTFTASMVSSLRTHWKIPCYQPRQHAEGTPRWSPLPKQPANWASCPPPCTAGSSTGSSPPSRPPPARRGGSGSPTSCAPASSKTPPTAICPCSKPPMPWACPGRRCCSVSSVATSTAVVSVPAAEKAYNKGSCTRRGPVLTTTSDQGAV